ncbi:hypothetical protein N0V82_009778 [Gnomoniopsis sp. IMI 355080]|nr:hypothetical protein N0V82_009778 [Gnomoniopsis sp. IMI 355080]
MISLTQITLLVASAALLVSAGPTSTPALEAVRTLSEADELVPGLVRSIPEEAYFDARSITDAGDPRLQKRNGELYCGTFASADFYNGHELVRNMINSPTDQHTIAANGCLRTSCMNTSGVYVCNDRSGALTVTNAQIDEHVKNILGRCCMHNKNGQADEQKQSGGQQFTDALGGGWNVILAYANCNHDATQKPSTYNGGTVNGIGCLPASFYID